MRIKQSQYPTKQFEAVSLCCYSYISCYHHFYFHLKTGVNTHRTLYLKTLSSKKEWDQDGYNWLFASSHTIADVFWVHWKGYSRAPIFQKPVIAFRAQKMLNLFWFRVCYQKLGGELWHCATCSPCDDTPTTAALTTGRVSLLICKKNFFVSLLPLAIYGLSTTRPSVTAKVPAVGVSSYGLKHSNTLPSFW
jgi:hypothetical protein